MMGVASAGDKPADRAQERQTVDGRPDCAAADTVPTFTTRQQVKTDWMWTVRPRVGWIPASPE